MNSNPSFPLIIDDYRDHLRTFPDSYLSFSAFCQSYNVRVQSVQQWMRRHGFDISTLYYEILLERSCSEPGFILPRTFGGKKACSCDKVSKASSITTAPGGEIIKGISITFPDGIVVNIRQATAPGLTKFIESYNKLNDRNHVQPE